LIFYFNYVWALATYQGTKGIEVQVGYIMLTGSPSQVLSSHHMRATKQVKYKFFKKNLQNCFRLALAVYGKVSLE